MRADNSHHIRQAAERRHELTRSKAVAALRELQKQGAAVTFEAVARRRIPVLALHPGGPARRHHRSAQ